MLFAKSTFVTCYRRSYYVLSATWRVCTTTKHTYFSLLHNEKLPCSDFQLFSQFLLTYCIELFCRLLGCYHVTSIKKSWYHANKKVEIRGTGMNEWVNLYIERMNVCVVPKVIRNVRQTTAEASMLHFFVLNVTIKICIGILHFISCSSSCADYFFAIYCTPVDVL